MSVPVELEALVEVDRIRELAGAGVRGFIHDDHRFVLPVVHYGQEKGLLPKPCKLVMLDLHSDALEPRSDDAMERIREMRARGFDHDELLKLTHHGLSDLDDDWLIAGMELGIFSDAALFGVDDGQRGEQTYTDHLGKTHQIFINGSMPGELLGYQGNLSDTARSYAVAPLWEILDWKHDEGRFKFVSDEPVLLTIDLDAFVVDWEDFTFPWPQEVWEGRFLKESEYPSTVGLSGAGFMAQVLRRTGMLAIAREPKHCGGEEKMRVILADLNRFVFEDGLSEVEPR